MTWLRIFIRSLESASRSLSSVKWKAAISILTILIGSLSISATFTISHNIDGFVNYLIDEHGGPKITVMNLSTQEHFDNRDLTYFRKMSVVDKAYFTGINMARFRNEDKASNIEANSVSTENLSYLQLKVKRGSPLTTSDIVNGSNVVVMSETAAKKLKFEFGKQNYINVKSKNSNEIRLRVLGIVEGKTDARGDYGRIWMSSSLFKEITGVKYNTNLHIVATHSQWMTWLANFSQKHFARRFGSDLWIDNPIEIFMQRKAELESFIEISYVLGFLALLAGSIGSTSLMVLNVNLRRKEIGLYKSMGFSSWLILFQFCCETSLVSLLGGAAGACLGCLVGYAVSIYLFDIATMSFLACGIGLGSALSIGMVFGLIPAVIAANTDPVKALQG